jgi:ABC-type multidrug transport system ATPase subunit
VFYALIKGIKASLLHKIVQQTIKKLDLVEHKDKRSESLSGGNKRKL